MSRNPSCIIHAFGVAKNPIAGNGVALNTWQDVDGRHVAIATGSAVGFRFAAHAKQTGVNCGRLTIVNIQSGCDPFVQAGQRGDIHLCIG